MKQIMSAESAQTFANLSRDENCLHVNEEMWRDYGVPALVPGMQTLCTALASIPSEKLSRLNYVRANFQRMIPVGSEVEFNNEEIGRGFWKSLFQFRSDETTKDLRISAYANGSDVLAASKDECSIAARVELLEKPSFNEGDSVLTTSIDSHYAEKFAELTGLPREAAFSLYALPFSSFSIAHKIKNLDNNSAPSWVELNNSLVAPADKRKIPAYESIEAYFPNGFSSDNYFTEINLRSAIRKEGNVYVIDTICDANGQRIYGVRANLKQRRQDVIVKGIGVLLDEIEKSGKAGTLEEAIKRRREFLATKSQAA